MEFKISRHTQQEMKKRGISDDIVKKVLESPDQIVKEYGNKKAYQSKIHFNGSKLHLVRVIVNDLVKPAVVVTLYRTSKIKKYWRNHESNL